MATMNPAALGAPYVVPSEPGRWSSLTLAALVHAGLLLFLWIGVQWQSTVPDGLEVEAWDMKVQTAAAPPLPQPVVVPPTPKPVPVSKPQPEPERVVPKPPDIRLEREKIKADKLKQKLADEKLAKEKAARELEDKNKKLDEKKLAEKDKAKKAADEKKALDKLHEQEMQRITGSGTTGTAAKSTAPRIDSGYVASLKAKIKSNIAYSGDTDMPGNPSAIYRIEQLPTGEILSVKKLKSSGVPAYDAAVENAIAKSSPLPRKKDGTVERSLEAVFEMKDTP